MAQRVTFALLAGALLACPQAHAQTALADPTRPPESVHPAGEPGSAEGTGGAGPRLLSVLIAGHRKLAVIDGRTVAPGDKLGEATVAEISETGVTLKRGTEVQTLRLYPGIEVRPVKRQAPAAKEREARR
jgi:Fe-S cluster assembly ATPase SufC